MTRDSHSGGRVTALDGLRGVAILMVLIAHFNQEGLLKLYCPVVGPILTKVALSGLFGVDLFFVLSGYLITGILLDAKGHAGYFTNFYARRLLRIFPLYYGALLAVFVVVPLCCSLDSAANDLSSRQWWLWLYMANVPGHPPWDSSEVFKLGHFWSLAVEEHFYLTWPLLVSLLSSRRLRSLCVSLLILAPSMRLVAAIGFVDPFGLLKWSTLARIDGLSCGSLLAVLIRNRDFAGERLLDWSRMGIRILGPAFLALAFVPRSFWPAYVGSFQITVSVGLFASILLQSTRSDRSVIRRVMSLKCLVTLGKYSYGLYVIHGLLRPALERWLPPETLIHALRIPIVGLGAYSAYAVGVCFLLAFISWHLYEKHFLKLKRHFEYHSRQTMESTRLAPGLAAESEVIAPARGGP